jgi:L-lactate dehydrogenase complex protein LldG
MSRNKILGNININKPASLPLNDFAFQEAENKGLDAFIDAVKSVGGNVIPVRDFNIEKEYSSVKTVGSKMDDYTGNIDLDNASFDELKSLDLALLKGDFGVAENAAIWLPQDNMGQRIVPFIAEYLVIFLSKEQIVSTMHEAYQRIQNVPDYGVFISGPSKTADIEQTLVLGAQGPMRLDVVLTD